MGKPVCAICLLLYLVLLEYIHPLLSVQSVVNIPVTIAEFAKAGDKFSYFVGPMIDNLVEFEDVQ